MTHTEVEFRGHLREKEFFELKKFMQKNAKFLGEKDRLSLVYFRDNVPHSLKDIKDEKVDLKLRVTNKKSELVLKYGKFSGSDSRKEFLFPIKNKDFVKMADFLKCLGWKYGIFMPTKTYFYNYQGITFSLVFTQDYGYNYEAEILTHNKKQENQAKEKIKSICKELKLTFFTEKDFYKWCDKLNRDKDLQFDFDRQNPNIVLKKYKDYF